MKYELMGKIVTVKAYLKRSKHWDSAIIGTSKITWNLTDMLPPRAGWVIGYGCVYDGISVWDGDCRCFENKGTHKIIKVALWPTTKPIITTTKYVEVGGVPQAPGWTIENKEDLSRTMWNEYHNVNGGAGFPRDEKGRFISY